jgi:hypothetical protein
MPAGTPRNFIIFGRGLCSDGSEFFLSEASAARVRALVDYIEENKSVFDKQRAVVVFSGGWAGAAKGMEAPPEQFREGALMFELATALQINGRDFSRYADSYIEIESDSTLENILRTKEAGYLHADVFSSGDPLGIVAHRDHQRRIEYFACKVFGLSGESTLRIHADGPDPTGGILSEKMLFAFTKLAFLGATSNSSLRRRQRFVLTIHNLLSTRLNSDPAR